MSPSKQKSFFSEEVAKVNLDNIIHHPLFFTKNSKLQKLEIRRERERELMKTEIFLFVFNNFFHKNGQAGARGWLQSMSLI